MKIRDFELERWQSKWEHQVHYNMSESGVHPLTFEELSDEDDIKKILRTKLGYIQTDGTPELKEEIIKFYPEIHKNNILVTTGSIEANFLLIWHLLEKGDEAVFMLPNFMQIFGLMEGFGANVKTFYLKENLEWNPDINDLKKTITKNTKIIAITNPNNPTGSQLNEDARNTILDLAKWANAWLISDEVYQGAELNGTLTPSFYGTYEKTIVVSGLSKSYGLPGLRVGWIAGPENLIQNLWSYKDYTSIAISALSDRLARIALQTQVRTKIYERTRGIIKRNFSILDSWMKKFKNLFECIPPKAGAICFPSYNLDINSSDLAHKIRKDKSVLIQPGDQLGVDHHIRFGLGQQEDEFKKALKLVGESFEEYIELSKL